MPRRLLVVSGLVLGLLGMHGLAPGYPAAGARELPMPLTASASTAPMAAGHGPSTPVHHHEPGMHHDLCTAILTDSTNAAGGAGAVHSPSRFERADLVAETTTGRLPVDPRPPDLFALGVLRI